MGFDLTSMAVIETTVSMTLMLSVSIAAYRFCEYQYENT
jgi:hypothetical protein